MARGLNRVQLIGHLGADPETRYTAGGQAVTTFRVAVNRTRRDPQSGQPVDDTEWFRVVAWEKLAEIAGEYLRKGNLVYVEGRLQSRKYTGWDGVERVAVEVVASDLVLLGGREASEGMARDTPGRGRSAPSTAEIDPENPPF